MDALPKLPFAGLENEAALQAIAEAMPNGVFTTDAEGRITYWNRAAQEITGWSSAEALGRDCSLLAGDAVRGCSCGLGPLRCGMIERRGSAKSCTIRAKDGRLLVIVKNAVPVFAKGGAPVGALESFTEIAPAAAPPPREQPEFCGLVGRHPSMQELYKSIDLVGRSDATVMILGESGVGKERVTEAIHMRSGRADGPFVRVSCSALNENLLESELFGHVRGAFTGALRERRGRFQEAEGGTLFLDEIGDISPVVQLKLLRCIEERQIERVGDSQSVDVDVRIVCATHRNLKQLVQAGRFRADLYFRLAVFPLHVPPLRERIEDLPLLAERFLASRSAPGAPPTVIDPPALSALMAYSWPGNVRELQNVLEFAALRADGQPIALQHLPPEARSSQSPAAQQPPAPGPASAGREEILAALAACGGNRTLAARRLRMSRVTLWKRLKEMGADERSPFTGRRER